MITLGQLKIKLNFAIGTSETNLLTNEKRIDALNTAIQNILEQYPIPQYVTPTDLTFITGLANLPADCLVPLKMTYPTDAYTEYDEVDWRKFPLNLSQTYTIQWNDTLKVEQLAIYPQTPNVLRFWYIQNPPDLVIDSDAARFNVWWEKAIAEKAAEKLLTDSATFNRAQAKKQVADDLIAKAWQTDRARITGIQDNRMTSIFTQRSLLQFRSSLTQ